jgi:hypothetical protein
MSNLARQIFFGVAVGLFICTITVVLFYGSGYSFNWQSGQIETTSGITLIAKPTTAQITLEPGGLTKSTPARFNQLDPNSYSVTVVADGYHSQTFQVTLSGQAAVQFDPVQLWPTTPTPVLSLAATNPTISTAQTRLNGVDTIVHQQTNTSRWLLQQTHSLLVYDPDSKTTTTIARLSEPIIAATWHPNGWYVFYSTNDALHMIDTRTNYTQHDIILTRADVASNLVCARNGWTCSYTSAGRTYLISLR